MRWTTMLGLGIAIPLPALAFGCSGADQVNAGSNTGGSPGTGGSGAGGDNTGAAGAGGSATGGTSTGGNANTGGASTGGANTGGNANTGGSSMCTPITEDASKIGTPCNPDGSGCPGGYTCQPFAGIAVTYACAILCEEDCECPAGGTCITKSDKGSSWKECSKP